MKAIDWFMLFLFLAMTVGAAIILALYASWGVGLFLIYLGAALALVMAYLAYKDITRPPSP